MAKRKTSIGPLVGTIFKRLLHPKHLWRAWRLQAEKKKIRKSLDDKQLVLANSVFKSGHLHYAYFENADTAAEEISLKDVQDAQQAYAEQILDLVTETGGPVFDVGCGMGGILGELKKRGFETVGLTPDLNQINFLRDNYPDTTFVHSRFEDLDSSEHQGKYSTVITAESLQYLKLDRALPLMEQVLQPDGHWIAGDYFRISDSTGSGHVWNEFETRVRDAGWKFDLSRDITAHVLPGLGYTYLIGHDMIWEVIRFAFERMQRKEPGLHYLCEEAIELLTELAESRLREVDPDYFAAHKQYRLLKLSRV